MPCNCRVCEQVPEDGRSLKHRNPVCKECRLPHAPSLTCEAAEKLYEADALLVRYAK